MVRKAPVEVIIHGRLNNLKRGSPPSRGETERAHRVQIHPGVHRMALRVGCVGLYCAGPRRERWATSYAGSFAPAQRAGAAFASIAKTARRPLAPLKLALLPAWHPMLRPVYALLSWPVNSA